MVYQAYLLLVLAFVTAAVPPAPRMVKETFGSGGRTRTYYLFAPDSVKKGEAAPVLVLLHGSGRTGDSLLEKWTAIARRDGIILAGPDASSKEGWAIPEDGPDYLYDLVETLRAQYDIDPARVYLFGHSAGAGHALAMGVLESEYFAAVAVHAGVLNEGMFPLIERAPRKIPMAIWVGDSDPLFPVRVVQATQESLNKHGFDAQLTVIGTHTHWYYDRAPEINAKVWAFLQRQRLDGEPKYQRYQLSR
jgi:poly(3-hydroxybutyrate) depolymerase